MEIAKIAVIAIITAILTILTKQQRPEYASLVQLGGVVAILLYIINYIPSIVADINSMLSFSGADSQQIQTLVKIIGVAVVTEIATETCRDNDSNALASNVEFAGKILIMALSLPLIRALAELAAGLIK